MKLGYVGREILYKCSEWTTNFNDRVNVNLFCSQNFRYQTLSITEERRIFFLREGGAIPMVFNERRVINRR